MSFCPIYSSSLATFMHNHSLIDFTQLVLGKILRHKLTKLLDIMMLMNKLGHENPLLHPQIILSFFRKLKMPEPFKKCGKFHFTEILK